MARKGAPSRGSSAKGRASGGRRRGSAIQLRDSDVRKLGVVEVEGEGFQSASEVASDDSDLEREREKELLEKRMQLQGADAETDDESSSDAEVGDDFGDEESDEEEDSDAADEDDDELGGKSRTAWGRRAKDFYQGESSEGDSSSDEEAMDLRAQEAERVLERDEAQGLTREHFGDAAALEGLQSLLKLQGKAPLEEASKETAANKDKFWASRVEAEVDAILAGLEASAKDEPEELSSMAGLSEEERKALVEKTHPELLTLMQQLEASLTEVSNTLAPVLAMVKSKEFLTKEGITLLDAKNQLLLTYLSYLAYYILLKTHGLPVAAHPVVDRLIEVKLLLQKLQPIERAVKPEIDRLAALAQKATPAHSATAAVRARPEAFVPVGDEDSSPSEAEDPHREQDGDSAASEGESDGSQGPSAEAKYKPPKMLAVEFTGDKISSETKAAKNLQRAAARMQRSELVRAVREATGDAPETVGIERWIAAKAHGDLGFLTGGSARDDDDDDDAADFLAMRRSLSKKERRAQAAKRALYERRSAQALGDSLDDLAVFAEQSVGIADADDPLFGPAKKQRAPKGVLGRYLNAAKQVAEETAKMDRARADSLVLSREIQERPLRRSEGPAKPRRSQGEESLAEDEDDAEFRELASAARARKEAKKSRMKEKALSFLPEIEEEVEGQRAVTRDIEKNRGLTRKRKKFEGNARVHNRLKFAKKTTKLKSIRPEMRAFEDRGYEGEVSGIRSQLKKSKTLA